VPERKTAVIAGEVKPRLGTNYPPQYAENCKARQKRALGDQFQLTQFAVNLTTLPPGCWSSLRHWHRNEDEFVYVLEGEVVPALPAVSLGESERGNGVAGKDALQRLDRFWNDTIAYRM
jgi:hypothetical protein